MEEACLCNDINVVLRVCKYFAETGKLDRGVDWEEKVQQRRVSEDETV